MQRQDTRTIHDESQRRVSLCPAAWGCCLLAVCCLLAGLLGCRLVGYGGVVSHQLAACRKLSQQGVAAIEAQRWAEAEELMSKAVRACPTDGDAKRHYAEALWHRGKRAEAIAQLKAVVENSPHDANVRVRLGEMLLAGGHLSAALEQAEAAMDLAPSVAGTWAFRARVLRKKGFPQRALADYQRSLAYCPEDRDVLFETAEAYRQLGKPHEALAMLNSLSDTYPLGEEPKEVIRRQGLALAALGRFSAAVESYRKLVPRDEATADDFFELADAEWRAGSREKAVLAARRALELDPSHQRGRDFLARLRNSTKPAGILQR